MAPEQLIRTARRRAGMKFGFLVHLAVFVAVNALLFAINRQTMPGHAWLPLPLGGWAFGLSLHGLAVYFPASGLRERLVEDELRKLESRRAPGAG